MMPSGKLGRSMFPDGDLLEVVAAQRQVRYGTYLRHAPWPDDPAEGTHSSLMSLGCMRGGAGKEMVTNGQQSLSRRQIPRAAGAQIQSAVGPPMRGTCWWVGGGYDMQSKETRRICRAAQRTCTKSVCHAFRLATTPRQFAQGMSGARLRGEIDLLLDTRELLVGRRGEGEGRRGQEVMYTQRYETFSGILGFVDGDRVRARWTSRTSRSMRKEKKQYVWRLDSWHSPRSSRPRYGTRQGVVVQRDVPSEGGRREEGYKQHRRRRPSRRGPSRRRYFWGTAREPGKQQHHQATTPSPCSAPRCLSPTLYLASVTSLSPTTRSAHATRPAAVQCHLSPPPPASSSSSSPPVPCIQVRTHLSKGPEREGRREGAGVTA